MTVRQLDNVAGLSDTRNMTPTTRRRLWTVTIILMILSALGQLVLIPALTA